MPCTTPAEITFAILDDPRAEAYVYTEGASEFVRTIMTYTRHYGMRVVSVA